MKHALILILLLTLIVGCSYPIVSYKDIRLAAQEVYLEDGVDEREAVLLAQNEIVMRGLGDRLYSLKPMGVEKRLTATIDGEVYKLAVAPEGKTEFSVHKVWVVLFRDKEESRLWGIYPVRPFVAQVDMESGEVVRLGFDVDTEKTVRP